jgi:hypothetical protein
MVAKTSEVATNALTIVPFFVGRRLAGGGILMEIGVNVGLLLTEGGTSEREE